MPRAFPPLLGPRPTLLICGTMPSAESLKRRQFYGHPQNKFWTLMGLVLDEEGLETRPYAKRVGLLKKRGVALWDVLQSCTREGSLDSAIKDAVPSDIPGLLKRRPSIRAVAFTGKAAEGFFRRFHRAALPALERRVALVSLPSPSPANAAIGFEAKARAYRRLQRFIVPGF